MEEWHSTGLVSEEKGWTCITGQIYCLHLSLAYMIEQYLPALVYTFVSKSEGSRRDESLLLEGMPILWKCEGSVVTSV